ncbi:hypothetical protein [Prevotella fusca]
MLIFYCIFAGCCGHEGRSMDELAVPCNDEVQSRKQYVNTWYILYLGIWISLNNSILCRIIRI